MKAAVAPNVSVTKPKPSVIKQKIYNQRYLFAMSLPFLVWVIIFSYIPLFGWIMAFQTYLPARSIFDQEWVGLQNFTSFLTDSRFHEVIRNTIAMSFLNLVFGIICSVGLALLINETKNEFFKRTVQTLSYLPHFVSWVIVTSIFYTLLAPDGTLNQILMTFGLIDGPYAWMANAKLFWVTVTAAGIWKEAGWGAIIYLAVMSGIDKQLYEAADVDGVGRLGKIWYITLPGIRNVIMLLLILNIGSFFSGSIISGGGFDPSYLLGNPITREYSDNLAVYAYRYGLEMSRYSMSTAISIFNSILSLILLFSANKISSKFTGERII